MNYLRQVSIILICTIITLTSCTNSENHQTQNNDSIVSLSNDEIFQIASAILSRDKNEMIWNLTDVDSVPQLDTMDFFTNSNTKDRLILMSGHAGLSSGTADNLLILFENNSKNVLFACQIGNIAPEDLRDLTNDGIKEIISKSYSIYQGECNDNVNIFNLKNGKQNILYKNFSKSVIECGLENLNSTYKQGDTLEEKFEFSIKNTVKNEYYIEQIKTTKIHNGGKNNAEIIKNANITYENKSIYLN